MAAAADQVIVVSPDEKSIPLTRDIAEVLDIPRRKVIGAVIMAGAASKAA